jgi:hypothetical protein
MYLGAKEGVKEGLKSGVFTLVGVKAADPDSLKLVGVKEAL